MKRLICKVRGHRWNEVAQQNGVNHCKFCDYCDWGIHSNGFGDLTLRDEDRLWGEAQDAHGTGDGIVNDET